jgi:hypothetical protein
MSNFPIPGPLSLGDLLDRSFRLCRARFGIFVGTAAIFLVPMSIISGLLTGTFITDYMDALTALGASTASPSEEDAFRIFGGFVGFGVGMFALGVISLILNGIVTLALTSQSMAALHGEPQTVGQGVRRALSRFWPFVRMSILQSLVIFAATLGILIPLGILIFLVVVVAGVVGLGVGNFDEASGIVAMIGLGLLFVCGYLFALILMLVPTIYLSARWVVAVPALVNDGVGAREALRRSWALTQGGVWRAVGYTLLLWLIGALVIYMPLAFFQQILVIVLATVAPTAATTVSTALGSLFSVLWVPFNAGALVLLYYDLRVRKESYDLELRIGQMAAETAEETKAADDADENQS